MAAPPASKRIGFFLDMSTVASGWDVDSRGSAISGTAGAVLEVSRHFLEGGHALIMATTPPNQASEGVVIVKDLEDAIGRAAEIGLDTLVFNAQSTPYQIGLLGRLNAGQTRLLAWAHNPPSPDWLAAANCSPSIRQMICLSTLQALGIIHNAIFPKLVVVPYFLDFSAWPPLPPASSKSIVYIGALKETKGFHHLANVWPEVRQAVPGCSLEVCGSPGLYGATGPLGTEEIAEVDYEKRILAPLGGTRASALELGVRFLGSVDKATIRKTAGESVAVVVNPNVRGSLETFCLSALEALALERPVLGGWAGSLPEVIGHKRGGLLHRNEKELQQNLSELLLHPEYGIKLAKAGRRHSEVTFAPSRILKMWEDLLLNDRIAELRPQRSGIKPRGYYLRFMASKLLPASAVEAIQRRPRK